MKIKMSNAAKPYTVTVPDTMIAEAMKLAVEKNQPQWIIDDGALDGHDIKIDPDGIDNGGTRLFRVTKHGVEENPVVEIVSKEG